MMAAPISQWIADHARAQGVDVRQVSEASLPVHTPRGRLGFYRCRLGNVSTASLAAAIATAEGANVPGSIPQKANNPGNLELGDIGYGVLTAAGGEKITIFPDWSTDLAYCVQIDASVPSPDTFEWGTGGSCSNGATGVSMTAGAHTLSNGVTITFAATDGHTIGDNWTFTAYAPIPLTLQDHTGATALIVKETGMIVGATGVATGTASNTDFAGVMTASGGTATYSFTGTYTTAPVCILQDDTTLASLLTKTITTSGISATTTGTTDSVSYICAGRN
jgi:hypothetical protein